jgi:hypothetical protein
VSFAARASQHDKDAIPVVVSAFESVGFACYDLGTETDSDELHQALMSQYDETSIMLRFRPDRVFIRRGYRSVLCEIKSESQGYPNFAMEADSYQAAHKWDADCERVMYAFVDLSQEQARMVCCWVGDIPLPSQIRVPRRWDFEQQTERMRMAYPGADVIPARYVPGKQSGTPYFLIRKFSPYLKPFGQFMNSLIGVGSQAVQLQMPERVRSC